MATFNSFILLPATCRSTAIPRERIVVFPWQQWSREHAMMLCYACVTYLVSFVWKWCVVVRDATSFRPSLFAWAARWTNSYFTQGENVSFTETKYDSTSEMIPGTIVSQRDCFMESFVIRFASSAYPSSHPDRTWDSVCRPLTSLTAA